MTEAKHTPGKWVVDDDGFISAGHGEEYATIADCDCSDLDIDEREANKTLIAQAPDLLAENDKLKALNAELVGALRGLHSVGLMVSARLDVEATDRDGESYCCAGIHADLKNRTEEAWAAILKAQEADK